MRAKVQVLKDYSYFLVEEEEDAKAEAKTKEDETEVEINLLDQLFQVVAERAHVGRQFLGVFLEREQHAGLGETFRPVHEEADAEQGFSGAGPARHERRPAGGEPAKGDFIESRYPGARFSNCVAMKTILGHET